MAIRLLVKHIPSEAEKIKIREIVECHCDKRWAPYMIFKGEVMLEQGYSISEVENCFSEKSMKV